MTLHWAMMDPGPGRVARARCEWSRDNLKPRVPGQGGPASARDVTRCLKLDVRVIMIITRVVPTRVITGCAVARARARARVARTRWPGDGACSRVAAAAAAGPAAKLSPSVNLPVGM